MPTPKNQINILDEALKIKSLTIKIFFAEERHDKILATTFNNTIKFILSPRLIQNPS